MEQLKVNVVMIPTTESAGQFYDALWYYPQTKTLVMDGNQQHLYFVSNRPVNKPGDWCMFYNQISKVIRIEGECAIIETQTVVSESDAEFINSIKGEGTTKAGNIGILNHGFSISQLPRIEASTNPELGLSPPSEEFMQKYVRMRKMGEPIEVAKIEMVDMFVSGNYKNTCIHCGASIDNVHRKWYLCQKCSVTPKLKHNATVTVTPYTIEDELEEQFSELRKCKDSPYYFATRYVTVDGKPFRTSLTEQQFNRQFQSFLNNL